MIHRGEIINIAMDAWKESGNGWVTTTWFHDRADAFEAFARKVESRAAAAEREACKQAADEQWVKDPRISGGDAIRARGAA